ncbi:hypothetical protein RHAB21_02509 [Pseudorhizobium halotolerans]|uniref:DUF2313 domain-containing protein n=1 Tax=Pseudorhizobium halotolerans TaxID=1233081 RepID=A0ABM8PLD2_9HYPH|nr:putative phage tail protein [Pseudorhizobium halotolerans]CAD7036315.1 hypothetical protein RHAB21_02509 [Pseudorhizobium halotolerans]
MPRSPAFNTITRAAAPALDTSGVPVPEDALAAPTSEGLISAAMTLWPQGAAWGSPDGEAVPLTDPLARFTRVLLDPFVRLYARAWSLVREATVGGVQELLPDWEAEYGLPERCFIGEQSTSQRITALARKVRADAINHPEEFVRLALDYGFEIEIEEPAIFECGFSECGGYHAVGSWTEETYWIVRVKDAAISYFECGVSECGHDPLFAVGEAEQILCLLRQMAPAWTLPVLEPWVTLAVLATPDGSVLTDPYGNALAVPVNV